MMIIWTEHGRGEGHDMFSGQGRLMGPMQREKRKEPENEERFNKA